MWDWKKVIFQGKCLILWIAQKMIFFMFFILHSHTHSRTWRPRDLPWMVGKGTDMLCNMFSPWTEHWRMGIEETGSWDKELMERLMKGLKVGGMWLNSGWIKRPAAYEKILISLGLFPVLLFCNTESQRVLLRRKRAGTLFHTQNNSSAWIRF